MSDSGDRRRFHERRINGEPDLSRRLGWACAFLASEASRTDQRTLKDLIVEVHRLAAELNGKG